MTEQDGNSAVSDATDEQESTANEESEDESGDKNSVGISQLREEKLETVRNADTEELADELAAQRLQIEELQSDLEDSEDEIADLTSRLKRKQADFQNYKKRMEQKREKEKQRATESLVERLLDVRDNLKRALEQDDPEDLREGVESTFRQFESELDRENVTPIEPEPGEDVDPNRHEVLVRMESDHREGTVADVHRPGYEMAEKVLRPAQVAVSNGPADDNEEADAGPTGENEESST